MLHQPWHDKRVVAEWFLRSAFDVALDGPDDSTNQHHRVLNETVRFYAAVRHAWAQVIDGVWTTVVFFFFANVECDNTLGDCKVARLTRSNAKRIAHEALENEECTSILSRNKS